MKHYSANSCIEEAINLVNAARNMKIYCSKEEFEDLVGKLKASIISLDLATPSELKNKKFFLFDVKWHMSGDRFTHKKITVRTIDKKSAIRLEIAKRALVEPSKVIIEDFNKLYQCNK